MATVVAMSESGGPERVPNGKVRARRTPERQLGPVTLRRGQVQESTTDQRLLDHRGPSDWVHTCLLYTSPSPRDS